MIGKTSNTVVLGYYDSKEVDSFLWWKELPNISEYDTIILDTAQLLNHWSGRIEHVAGDDYRLTEPNSLDDKVDSNLERIRKRLLEKLEFDATIYVVYVPGIRICRPPQDPICTDEWCPLTVDTIRDSGTIIDPVDKAYGEYFSRFKSWGYYFVPDSINTWEIQGHYLKKWALTIHPRPLAVNKLK